MILRGSSVYLRALEEKDIERLKFLACRSSAHKSTTPFWRPWSRIDFEDYIRKSVSPKKDRISLAICLNQAENGEELIGTVDLHKINWIHGHAEIGIIIWPENLRGHGYGTDTLTIVAKWAFGTLRLRRLFAKMFASNKASARCFEKAGFQREGIWRRHYYLNGNSEDAILYGLLREEHFATKHNPASEVHIANSPALGA